MRDRSMRMRIMHPRIRMRISAPTYAINNTNSLQAMALAKKTRILNEKRWYLFLWENDFLKKQNETNRKFISKDLQS
jgi:hypothetical protein